MTLLYIIISFIMGCSVYFIMYYEMKYYEIKTNKKAGYIFVPVLGLIGVLLAYLSLDEGMNWRIQYFYLVFLIMLLLIGCVDLMTFRIEPLYVFILFIVGVVVFREVDLFTRTAGALCISLLLAFINRFIRKGFGSGDILLFFAAGFVLGYKRIWYAFVFSLFLGSIYGIVEIIRGSKNRNSMIPYGPWIVMGIYLVLFLS